MRTRTRFASIALAPFLVVGCASASPPAAPSGPPAWSYAGDTGPAHWGELDPSFAACGRGQAQSPIDLPAHPTQSRAKAPAPPKWSPIPIRVTNDGHSIGLDDPAPSSFVVDGTEYALASIHLHSPAEHTIEGRAFDAEMDLVHKSKDGKRLVVALLFQRGRENEVLRPVWDAIPSSARSEPVDTGKTFDATALLPKAPKYVRYEGSLPVPPCTEGITWLVIEPDPEVPAQMSDGQIGRLRAALHGPTNRPIQPLNGRPVVELRP